MKELVFTTPTDSTFALFWTLTQGFDPILITVRAKAYSMMFHHPNIDKTGLQAKALGIKQYFLKTTDADWQHDLKKLLKKIKAEGIASGAVASEYQRRRIEKLGEKLDIPAYAPLWHKENELMDELLDYFEAYVTAVAAEGLGKEWLGKNFRKLKEAKIANIHPFLEGGEGETFVANAPFFKHKIKIKGWKKKWDGVRGEAFLK